MLFQDKDVEIISQEKIFGKKIATVKILSTGEITRVSVTDLYDKEKPIGNLIIFRAVAAKIKSEMLTQTMIAPLESNIIPLPHQILALEKIMTGQYLRFLIADEVGMGKTIEAGLVLKELKIRGIVKKTLIIVPKTALGQWQQEMKNHFNEIFHVYDSEYINTVSKTFARLDLEKQINLFNQKDQIIVSMDSLKPLLNRRGWNEDQIREYNKHRIESVLDAEFDLLIIDECHKVGGSTVLVGRHQMADILCNAVPNVLLLSATPHRGKSDHFRRILTLLNSDAFAGEGMPEIKEIEPYIVRTEKRQAVDYNNKPLFNKRNTQKIIVSYNLSKHNKQKLLYEKVTDYVAEGFNLAVKTNDNSYGFVMLLFQKMVSSSTQAILEAMTKRRNKIKEESENTGTDNTVDDLDYLSFEGQLEVNYEDEIENVIEKTRTEHKAELTLLDELIVSARECIESETDAKVDFLLNCMTELKQSENDPYLKFLIFTEFTGTQKMLKQHLEQIGGYSCEMINGSMNYDQRVSALKKFKNEVQVLVSTDAAGESLNMQFVHIVINYDLPWNPMVLEQRIGRVDRIGQEKEVTAINILLDNSVNRRVYSVIEEKLNIILEQLGIDKSPDVLDSTMETSKIKKLYLTSLLNPEKFERESEDWLEDIKSKLQDYKSTEGTLPTMDSKDIKAEKIESIKFSPIPIWLETLIKNYLTYNDIPYTELMNGLNISFPGYENKAYSFDLKESLNNPNFEPISLQHKIVKKILEDAIPFTESQQIPIIRLRENNKVSGTWSIWQITAKSDIERQEAVQPIFISKQGDSLPTFAYKIWDSIIEENGYFSFMEKHSKDISAQIYKKNYREAELILQNNYEDLENKLIKNIENRRDNKLKSLSFQEKQINRIGIKNIKNSRQKKLNLERKKWDESFKKSKQIIPSLTCLLVLDITHE